MQANSFACDFVGAGTQIKVIVAKAFDGQRYTHALLKSVVIEVEGGGRAAAPKGLMTYAFTLMGNFLLFQETGGKKNG